jgi:hypothetical protein
VDLVAREGDIDGLGGMLAGLVEANLERDPARAVLLRDVSGTINIVAPDAEAQVGLEFAGGRLSVYPKPFRHAGIEIQGPSDVLLELTSVPLRFGLPDLMTPGGRAVIKRIIRRDLRVKGMVAHPVLLGRLNRLLSVL